MTENKPHIGIESADRAEIGDGLSNLLSDTYALYVQTQGYHWNVTGPTFPALHQMLEDQYLELQAAVDTIAERVRAVGERSPGSFAEFLERATVEDNKGATTAGQMVKDLIAGHETLIRVARPLVEIADKAGDVASADLVTERIRAHEKTAWMLRATDA
ncbi:Dps family protein [Demequina aurantiaca]|uniref:Dps family protein n=1 Tax=Demequina aurantiaca TaxID=676200 RepID=UPI003D33E176